MLTQKALLLLVKLLLKVVNILLQPGILLWAIRSKVDFAMAIGAGCANRARIIWTVVC